MLVLVDIDKLSEFDVETDGDSLVLTLVELDALRELDTL